MDKDFIKKGIELIKKADAAYLTTIDTEGFLQHELCLI